jgi:hypothetical protein
MPLKKASCLKFRQDWLQLYRSLTSLGMLSFNLKQDNDKGLMIVINKTLSRFN